MPKIKIAIADDYSVYRDGLNVTLSSDDRLQVIMEADNGKDLLQKMEQELPDLILMDYKMPGMDGLEATRIIREKHPGIKVLIISMYQDEKFIRLLTENGADGYLLKDTEPAAILAAIHQLFNEV
ncbi:MAG: response regulator transcription factor [Sphingobacteriales bacterium]|nr:response regulator transcription factor [Sphingobacteriales bacterium]